MEVKQVKGLLEKLRWINIEMIKAQDVGDKKQEELLETHMSGVTFVLQTFGYENFLDTFFECECGHNFGLTGNETEEELKAHYKAMDDYYFEYKKKGSGESVQRNQRTFR